MPKLQETTANNRLIAARARYIRRDRVEQAGKIFSDGKYRGDYRHADSCHDQAVLDRGRTGIFADKPVC